ncbi:MAG: cytochrome P450 [Cyanobacteria bacterium J06642_2]
MVNEIAPLPPGEFGLPVIGQTLNFFFDPDFVRKQYDRYGPIFKSRLIGRPTVFMVGAEAAEFLLTKGFDYFSWREGWPATFRLLLGESLFLQEGAEHRRNRRLLMPAFHGAALARYVETMDAIATAYFQKWEAKRSLHWFEDFKQLTFDIASQLLLGSSTGDETARLSQDFSILTEGFFTLNPLQLPFTKLGKAIAARERLLKHLRTVVQHRQKQPTDDALSFLVQARDEDGNGLSTEELTAQAMLLLFAGHETTTSMLTWLCLELARHPDVLTNARQEQAALDANKLNIERLSKMSYLDRVLAEVERLHPPVGGGFRGVVKPFEFKGYHVPAGWMAQYSIAHTHRLPELHPDPEIFDPDRHSLDRASLRQNPFSLIGFGGGPRVCVGMAFAKLEMKLVAARLLQRYQWQLKPEQSLDAVTIPTRRPKDGLQVEFVRLQ